MKRLVVPLLAIVAVYAALCAGLYFGQRSLLYFPPAAARTARADVLWLTSDGVRLKLWAVRQQASNAILYFGGNAEDAAWYVDDLSALFPDAALYLVNYRGYGGSGGSPSETALTADAERVFDFVRERHAEVSVIGRSLGSGIAVDLAAKRDVDRLVLVTPYDSVLNVAKKAFALFPVSWLLKDKFDSLAKAGAVRAPTLVLIAGRDRVIPLASTERLLRALPATTARVTIAGATHDSITDSRDYRTALRAFLAP